jgi:hypothetical protein
MIRTLALSAAISSPAFAQPIYRTDDGQPDGLVLTSFSDLLLLNYYFVEPPHDPITRIVVANPGAEVSSGTALVWDDPDDDGDPTNATLISSTPFVAEAGAFELVGVDIPPAQVAGGFAVGVLLRAAEGPRTWMDRTEPTGAAWILTGDGLDPADLAGIHAPGVAANWFIRAVAGEAPCYADCDESGGLDFFDFLCFQEVFAAGEARADCDGSGGLDFFDFLCYQAEFAAGCL